MNPSYEKALEILAEIEAKGFMEKTLRPAQRKAIKGILHLYYTVGKKYVVLTAPTGSGKSLIAAVISSILHDVKGFKTNLTTSSRALQKQYGEDLITDERFKVIMGNANYRCSLFKKMDPKRKMIYHNDWSTTGESPCQEWKSKVNNYWGDAEAVTRSPEQIKTLHTDQDTEVLKNVNGTYYNIDEMQSGKDSNGSPIMISMGVVKKVCREQGSCSFLLAREVAEEAPVAIRSIQHMAFYIMFGVLQDGIPVLQERDVHINDECHNIDGVFRELFSCKFSQNYYNECVSKTLGKTKGPDDLLYDFSKYKKSLGKGWLDEERVKLCQRLATDLGKVVEAAILPVENFYREEKVRLHTAEDFIRAAAQGKVFADLDSLDKYSKTVLKWYKNLTHASQDSAKATAAKIVGRRYEKRFASAINKKEGELYVDVFPVTLEDMLGNYMGKELTVFMSATPQPPDVFEKMMGLKGKVGYIEVPSDFPPERSPIYWDPADKITKDRAKEIGYGLIDNTKYTKGTAAGDEAAEEAGYEVLHAKLAEKIREILNKFHGMAGIIPCAGYAMVRSLELCLSDIPRFIWATDSITNRDKINEFKKRSKNGEAVILVSAGIAEGHSFDDDVSRLQIIPKMPMAPYDDIVKALQERWNTYYTGRTAVTLQQMVGRSMRNSNDYCVTVILDQKFDAVKSKAVQKLYSKHFLSCVKWDYDWRNFSPPG